MATTTSIPDNVSTGQTQSVPITAEVGSSGLKRASGYVLEEYLPVLRGRNFFKVIDEMTTADPIIGGTLLSIDALCRQVSWSVNPGGTSKDDEAAAQFLEECMHDMAHTWADFICEVFTMLPYGYAPHEIVYKRRDGKMSKYDDGKVGWRKIPLRAQSTVDKWAWDTDGSLQGFFQQDYYGTRIDMVNKDFQVFIPIEKALLFRTSTRYQNPMGRSILRTAYRPYYFMKRMEEIEAIGIERDLAGFPVLKLPAEVMSDKKYELVYEEWKQVIRNVRRDEQEGLILPSEFDRDGRQKYEFTLLSSGGQRQFDTNGIIERYRKSIAMSMLADFILLGHEGVGSFALSSDKTELFSLALGSFLNHIKETFNTFAVARLFKLNGFKVEKLPEIVYGDIETINLGEIGTFLGALHSAEMPLFPNPDLEDKLFEMANFPKITKEVRDEQERRRQEAAAALQQASQQPVQDDDKGTPEQEEAGATDDTQADDEERNPQ